MNLPYGSQNKLENVTYGLQVINLFQKRNDLNIGNVFVIKNGISQSGFFIGKPKKNLEEYFDCKGPLCVINLAKCSVPVKTPGHSWSFTGYKADMTPAGVLAHEIGHYTDFLFKWISRKREWKSILKKEKKVSSYEPNAQEAFAESMKVFILNSDLLKTGRPLRYNFIRNIVNIQPVIESPWKEVLKNAHPKIISAASNWIK